MLQKELQNKQSESSVEQHIDALSMIYKVVVEHESGVLQSSLWKELNLSSRDGSRLAIRLERRGMIKRERMLDGGRWTYILTPARMPARVESIEQIPCLTCPSEDRCCATGVVTPHHCNLIRDWTMNQYILQIKNNGNKT